LKGEAAKSANINYPTCVTCKPQQERDPKQRGSRVKNSSSSPQHKQAFSITFTLMHAPLNPLLAVRAGISKIEMNSRHSAFTVIAFA
jgi:hypothetical protein